jgi:SAM-dependent methyltransferase
LIDPMLDSGNLLVQLYRMDSAGGWNRGMRAINHALLAKIALIDAPVLELGCGGGVFAGELQARHLHAPVVGVDLYAAALSYAQSHAPRVRLAQSDLHRLPFAAGAFGLVSALDVLDQRGVIPQVALPEIRRILRPDGWLLLRVSANRWLHGPHDVAFNTGRRYGRADLAALLAGAGFGITRLTFADTLFAPAVVTLRLLQRWNLVPFTTDVYENPLADALLALALHLEAIWLAGAPLPFGVSLYALARNLTI